MGAESATSGYGIADFRPSLAFRTELRWFTAALTIVVLVSNDQDPAAGALAGFVSSAGFAAGAVGGLGESALAAG